MAISYGAKVSKTGQSVETAIDTDTIFSSKFSTLKILGKGDTSITTDGSGNGSVTISHGLNYAPAYYVWLKGTSQYTFLDAASYTNSFVPITQVGSTWIPDADKITAYTTASNLVISISGASPSTTYNFRYYYFVDLAQSFSSTSGINLVSNFGMKVSKTGYDVKTAEEYHMVYSQKYKSLQYYDVNYQTQTLTLPAMWADPNNKNVTAGVYVDFIHNLGYQPFFLAFALIPTTLNVGAIVTPANVYIPVEAGYGNLATSQAGYMIIDGFCDSTRIRISFVENSQATGTNNIGPKFNQNTVTIKVIIFTENLTT